MTQSIEIMAIKKLTYLDIPKAVRREKAAQAQAQYRALTINPHLSEQERAQAIKKQDLLSKWAEGSLPQEG